MSHADLRVEAIRQIVSAGFGLDSGCSDELLRRGGGDEQRIISLLNSVTAEDSPSRLSFFKTVREEEVGVEVAEEKTGVVSSDPGAEVISGADDVNKERSSHRTELKVVKHVEIDVAVNEFPERFLKSRVMNFIRNTSEPIGEPVDMNEADAMIRRQFDIDIRSGDPLEVLHDTLLHVYYPLISQRVLSAEHNQADSAPGGLDAGGGRKSSGKSSEELIARHDVLNKMTKFMGVVDTTLQRLQNEDAISLPIPELDLKQDVNVLLADPKMVEKLEQCVMKWETQITIVMEKQQKKRPQVPCPLAELGLWRDRASVLNALSDQLEEQPVVKKILEVMTKADSKIIHTLEETVNKLTKYRVKADNIFRFLKTMERHFMDLADGANFGMIRETIHPLMESLQTVWMISYHFKNGDHMAPLMEGIAWQLCDRVDQTIDVRALFKNKKEAKSQVHEAKQLLNQWKTSYFDMYTDIEKLRWKQRWDFDHKRLFERSDYMASVCQDLYNVLQILEEFANFFGPMPKRVTTEVELLDAVQARVKGLASPFEQISFNPFNILKMSSWKTTIQDFNNSVQAIDGEAMNLIDETCKKMRSSSAAFMILMRFKHVHSRETLKSHMMKKFDDVLAQYMKEVDTMVDIFEKEKDEPPLSKSDPPVAGAIKWARSLVHNLKQTLVLFLREPEQLHSEQIKAAKDKYMKFGVRLKEYEKKMYECWFTETECHLPLLLKNPLLAITTSENPIQAEVGVQSAEESQHRDVRYISNFPSKIREIISETDELIPLGFSVPGLARCVAPQELYFDRYTSDLERIASKYNSIIGSLSEAHLTMLAPHIEAIQNELNNGCKMINWKTLGIPDFISEASEALSKFETLYDRIRSTEEEIDSKLQAIATANLMNIPSPDKSNDLPGVREFCEHIERERVKTVNSLVGKYADIGFLIPKIEHLVMETSSGKAKCMADYYASLERKVLDSLMEMVQRNVQTLNMALMGSTALFQVDVILSAPKVVLQPNSSDIHSLIMQCVSDCVESTEEFVRWMRGTCIECPPIRVGDDDEFVTFTFGSDVLQHPLINESVASVSQSVQQLLLSVDRYLPHWRRYRALWENNIAIVNGRFAAKNPSCVTYDERLQFFTGIQQEVMSEPRFRNERVIRLNLKPLIVKVQQTTESWITSLGGFLNKPAKKDLFTLRDELTRLGKRLKWSPDNLEALKSVQSAISAIRDSSFEVETRYMSIKEIYRTLAMYKVEVAVDELELLANIEQMWEDLLTESRRVDRSLNDVKKSFSAMTETKH